jgi:hypothetical protein
MKKPTKKSMRNKLDKECSRIVRSRGICEWCGPVKYFAFNELQCCHIYSRANRAVRWDLLNLLSLCPKHHFYGHQHPLEFAGFVEAYLGPHKYAELKIRANTIKKWSISEMQEYLETLKGVR